MEHWLPLFYDHLDTLFDYLPRCLVMLGHQVEEAKAARLEVIADCYETRQQFRHQEPDKKAIKAAPYKPLKPEALYLTEAEWKAVLGKNLVRALTPFQAPESMTSVDAGGRQGRDFAPERSRRQSQCLPGRRGSPQSAAGGGPARAGGKLDRRLGRAHGRGVVRSRPRRHPPGGELAGGAEPASERRGIGLPGHRARLRSARLCRDERTGCAGRPHGAGAERASAARRISWPKRHRWRRAIWSPISNMAWRAIWA